MAARGVSSDEDPDGARPSGRSSRPNKHAAAQVNQYVCARCRLELGRSQFLSFNPPDAGIARKSARRSWAREGIAEQLSHAAGGRRTL
jgi:hypothetical protein